MVFKRPPDIKIHTGPVLCRPINRPNGKILQINSKNIPVAKAMGLFFCIVAFSRKKFTKLYIKPHYIYSKII